MTINKLIKIVLSLAIILGLSSSLFAQINKANKYFEEDKYSDAIVYYSKVLKKDNTNKEATQKIAFAYRKLKDYENAEVYYAKATEINPEESSNYLYYGQTLKNNNKIKEAKDQFKTFVDKNPNSFMGKLMVQSCGDIKEWEVQEKEFEVFHLENINSKNADFCPLVYEDGIIFVSERGVDLVNDNQFGMSNKPYLSIYFAKQEKQFKNAKRFSNRLNSVYHDGPVSISSDKKTMYFTRVGKKEQGKNYTNRLKIYSAILDGKKWKKITPFKYNSDDYSVAHPWISEDGTKLFFASDMSGGQGKMDIYVCTKEGEEWGAPVNLGKEANTSENDVFPYFRKGTLYFSSEGYSGYGGLDIYAVKESDQWQNPKNLKSPINSSKDDFGIFYKDDESGYFSSDREGGVGSDDIYRFAWHAVESQTSLSGLLEYDKLGSSGTTVNLLDEDDNIIGSVVTDEYGKFKFEKLDTDKNYLISIDETDESFLENAKLYLTNSNGEKVLVANKVSNGKFTFQALPFSYYDNLELLEEEDESLFKVTVFGQIYSKLPGDYSGEMEVWVVDDEGNIIGKTRADKDGKFSFDKLSPDEKYLFKLAEDDIALNMLIIDENGNVVEETKKLEDGKYLYDRIDSEKKSISLSGMIYKKLPGDYSGRMEVLVVDDEGNIIGRTIADKDGRFTFDKLSPDEEYLFMLAEEDEAINLIIVDENGDVVEQAKKLEDGKYHYLRLESEKNIITLINEMDEIIKITENDNFVISKIFYAYKSVEINNTSADELDKLVLILKKNKGIGIELSAHADAIGGEPYNMRLSQRRAAKVVKYVISKGIASNRIFAKSFGETQPIAPNLLPNGDDNPEGRAKNRRTEFKVKKLK